MNIVCIKNLYLPGKSNLATRSLATRQSCRFTQGKTYKIVYEDNNGIQIIDDDGISFTINKQRVDINYYFKYIQEVRNDKLKSLGI